MNWQHPEISREIAEVLLTQREEEIKEKLKSAQLKLKEELRGQERPATVEDCDCLSLSINHGQKGRINKLTRCQWRIQEAWERIKDGAWGICLECEEEISAARLESFPDSKLCVDCQSKKEKRKKMKSPYSPAYVFT